MMRRIGLVAALVLLSCQPRTAALNQVLDYEPVVVELRGRLVETERFGPPNYGENPQSDARVRLLIVQLREPVLVRADTANPVNNETVTGVTEVQLLLRPEAVAEYRTFVGRVVLARGTLSRAITGHHYTPVVMTLQELRATQ